ncbi:hypothetical protein G6F22_018721 [Rhizopus arrhizus]|nr:hypothetical protein G6F22_018721 [Rhizopus arrhizus]
MEQAGRAQRRPTARAAAAGAAPERAEVTHIVAFQPMPAEQQADPLRRTHHQPMLAPARAVRAERIEAAQPQVAARHQHALALVEQQVGIGGGDMLQHDRIDALVGQRQRQRAAGIAGIAVAVPVQSQAAPPQLCVVQPGRTRRDPQPGLGRQHRQLRQQQLPLQHAQRRRRFTVEPRGLARLTGALQRGHGPILCD